MLSFCCLTMYAENQASPDEILRLWADTEPMLCDGIVRMNDQFLNICLCILMGSSRKRGER